MIDVIIRKKAITIYKSDDSLRGTFQTPVEITEKMIENGWKSDKATYVYDPFFDALLVFKDENKLNEYLKLKESNQKKVGYVTKDDFESFKKDFMKDYLEFKAWKKAKLGPQSSSTEVETDE